MNFTARKFKESETHSQPTLARMWTTHLGVGKKEENLLGDYYNNPGKDDDYS